MSAVIASTGVEVLDRADGRYTIITAGSHAGGSHAAYRGDGTAPTAIGGEL
jgi:hypothetical protein